MKSRTTRNIQIEKPAEPRVAECGRRGASVRRQDDDQEGEERREGRGEMTSPIKTLFPLLLALILLAGCKGTVGNDTRSSAASTEKPSPTPTEAESRKTEAESRKTGPKLPVRAKEIVSDREGTASRAGEKRAVVEARRRVIDSMEELRAAKQRLCGEGCYKSALRAYAAEWKQMRNEYAILKKDAGPTLDRYRLNTVKNRLNSMKYRLNSYDYRRKSFESDARDADGRVKDVNKLIGRLNTDWKRLQRAVAPTRADAPRATIKAEDITKAVESARSEINKSARARDAAKSQAAAYDKQADDLYRQAEGFVKNLKPIDRD
jgi:chromosome segregation ATPase